MKIHSIKCWPDYFEPLVSGIKNFELRYDDRGYRAGDILFIEEFLPAKKLHTGRNLTKKVEYLRKIFEFCFGIF